MSWLGTGLDPDVGRLADPGRVPDPGSVSGPSVAVTVEVKIALLGAAQASSADAALVRGAVKILPWILDPRLGDLWTAGSAFPALYGLVVFSFARRADTGRPQLLPPVEIRFPKLGELQRVEGVSLRD